MATTALKIDGMSCGHCVKAVTMALQDLPGVQVRDVTVGRAVIDADDHVVTQEQIAQAIDEAGFTLAAADPA
ncbi:copper chaperone [Luteitalea sp. TBR-22]|uniref:heavy-metal-associated domain-containing protein n=1 Tax=Luteitalea sp. TBR-22 TaxID=2802971 RepID=UPI001AF71727|nr:heavy-metal-associated domain-containing protein [Luteitalea sp. TBR-22]BCS31953.1 copper chaperone [Luteitalea sp. TBR-22]